MPSGPVPVGPIPQSGNSESVSQEMLWDKYLKGIESVFIVNNLSVCVMCKRASVPLHDNTNGQAQALITRLNSRRGRGKSQGRFSTKIQLICSEL